MFACGRYQKTTILLNADTCELFLLPIRVKILHKIESACAELL